MSLLNIAELDAAAIFLAAHPGLTWPRRITSADELEVLFPGSVVVDDRGYAWTMMLNRMWDCAFTSGGRTAETLLFKTVTLTLIHEVTS